VETKKELFITPKNSFYYAPKPVSLLRPKNSIVISTKNHVVSAKKWSSLRPKTVLIFKNSKIFITSENSINYAETVVRLKNRVFAFKTVFLTLPKLPL